MSGRLIVIEGLDGSGKATQSQQLFDYMQSSGERVLKITFPDYDSESSALVKLYLRGELGSADEVNAYAASSFYSADRYISYKKSWGEQWRQGYTIISDRYTTSNAVHQMAKLPPEMWEEYLTWLWDYEFAKMKLPAPASVIYLDMPPELSRELMMKRYGGDKAKADIHEADFDYQQRCRSAAMFAAERLGWTVLSCNNGGELCSVEDMAERIREALGL